MLVGKLFRAAAGALLFVAMAACGGGGGGGTGSSGSGTSSGQTSDNVPPSFAGATTFSFPENSPVEFVLTISDPDSEQVTVTVQAGGDAQFFDVDPYSGQVLGATNFDFENPQDANHDNIYEQAVTLSDGVNTVSRTIRVQITNVDEPPVFAPPVPSHSNTISIAVDENYTGPVWRVQAEDPEGVPIVYSMYTPTNHSASDLFSVDATTGVLTLNSPLDADLAQDPFVDTWVKASAGPQFSVLSINVRINDIVGETVEGIRIVGEDPNLPFGDYANPVGDIDGDGLEEIWVTREAPGGFGGPAYFIWGKTLKEAMADGAANLTLSDLTEGKAIRFWLDTEYSLEPKWIIAAPAGDVDGDDTPDIVVAYKETLRESEILDRFQVRYAAVVFGDALNDFSDLDYQLRSPPLNAQVEIQGPQKEGLDISTSHGDFDGDGLSDLVFGAPVTNSVRIVFGKPLRDLRTGGYPTLDIDMAKALSTRSLTYKDEYGSVRELGEGVAGIRDLDGDGKDELLLSARHVGGYFVHGMLVVSGDMLSAAKIPGPPELVIEGPSTAGGFVRVTKDLKTLFQSISASGDVDHDGIPDAIVAEIPDYNEDQTGVATLIFGSTLKSALQSGTDISGEFSDPDLGFNITEPRMDGGALVATHVGFGENFTGGPGDEVMLALPASQGGRVAIFSDETFVSAAGSEIPLSQGLSFDGFGQYQTLNRNAFLTDFDGDGIVDLSLASPTALDVLIDRHRIEGAGAYFGLPGTVLQRVFDSGVKVYNLQPSLSVEPAGSAP